MAVAGGNIDYHDLPIGKRASPPTRPTPPFTHSARYMLLLEENQATGDTIMCPRLGTILLPSPALGNTYSIYDILIVVFQ